MRWKAISLAALLVLALSRWASALTLEDVVRLAKAHVGDDVILSQIEVSGSAFTLTTEDILRLRREGVSDAVLARMIRSRAPAAGASEGTLLIENKDARPYFVQVDPGSHTVTFYQGRSDSKNILGKDETLTVAVPPGTYTVKWLGEGPNREFALGAGETIRLVSAPVSFDRYVGVNLSVYREDRLLSTAVLKQFVGGTLEQPSPNGAAATAPPAGFVNSPPQPSAPPANAPAPAAIAVPAPTDPVYVNYYYPSYAPPVSTYVPAPVYTVVPSYRSVYVSPYYGSGYSRSYGSSCGSSYFGSYYGSSYRSYSYPVFGFSFSDCGRRSSFGFRFGH